MKIIQRLIYLCFILIGLGGAGTIAGLLTRTNGLRVPSMWVLLAGLGLFGATLVGALLLGVFYFIIDRQKVIEYMKRPVNGATEGAIVPRELADNR